MAADHTGRDHEYQALRACIDRQEREHRAFGRRLVGNIGARMSVSKATDYFVAKVLEQGLSRHDAGQASIATLCGLREDYVRGAILMSDGKFRENFLARLNGAFPGKSEAWIWGRIRELDYTKLI
jgi:hypothetical protein